jgi:hypothetical protein
MPCRGSGKILSGLGGSLSAVGCPWCNATGVKAAGVDAQAHWPASKEDHASAQSAAEPD